MSLNLHANLVTVRTTFLVPQTMNFRLVQSPAANLEVVTDLRLASASGSDE